MADFKQIAIPMTERGLKVTPLKGKAAFLPDWRNSASKDPAKIAEWAEQYPDHNSGVVKDDEFWFLDADSEAWFHEQLGYIKPVKTLKVRTPGGGYHYYFRHNTASRALSMRPVPNPEFDTKKTKEEQPGVKANLLEFPNQVVAP